MRNTGQDGGDVMYEGITPQSIPLAECSFSVHPHYRHGGCNTCPRLYDILLRTTLAELDMGPLMGPSDVRRQLRTLACVAGGALPTQDAVLQQITTLLQVGAITTGHLSCYFPWC